MTTHSRRPQRGCPVQDVAGQGQASHHRDHKSSEDRRGTENRKLPRMSTEGKQTSSVWAFSEFGRGGAARRSRAASNLDLSRAAAAAFPDTNPAAGRPGGRAGGEAEGGEGRRKGGQRGEERWEQRPL